MALEVNLIYCYSCHTYFQKGFKIACHESYEKSHLQKQHESIMQWKQAITLPDKLDHGKVAVIESKISFFF